MIVKKVKLGYQRRGPIRKVQRVSEGDERKFYLKGLNLKSII